MEETKVKNTLKDKEVQVREGNAKVTRLVSALKPGASTTIRSDPNATYKEYLIITLPDNTKLPTLSSDDFADFKVIHIVEGDDDKVEWKGTVPRRTPATTAVSAVATSPATTTTTTAPVEASPVSSPQLGFFKRLLNRFGLWL